MNQVSDINDLSLTVKMYENNKISLKASRELSQHTFCNNVLWNKMQRFIYLHNKNMFRRITLNSNTVYEISTFKLLN